MRTYYKSEVNFKGQGTELSIDLHAIQVFDDEMCERFIERIKKEIKDAKEESEKYEKENLSGELKKTYESNSLHRVRKVSIDNPQIQEIFATP